MNYPTAGYTFLVQGEGVKVASDRLTTGEPVDIEGVRFNQLSARELTPGERLVAEISGLPQTSKQGAILWVVLALLACIGGAGFVYVMRKSRLQPVSPRDNLDQRRQRILVEIARLDDDFEGGRIQEDVYWGQRAEKMAQVAVLIQRLKKERGGR
jgi:LPXTG-motif cell wall-anchored protein